MAAQRKARTHEASEKAPASAKSRRSSSAFDPKTFTGPFLRDRRRGFAWLRSLKEKA